MTTIAFQGTHGAYSDLACRQCFPENPTLPCASFDDAFAAVRENRADLAMIPVDNTLAGRVADVHHLMPEGGLSIIGEHFQPIRHSLLSVKGADIDGLQHIHSHVHAIPQCRQLIREKGLQTYIHADTAGAAAEVARMDDPAHAAIASELAAEIYGLEILQHDIQDADHNTTRFLILAREPAGLGPQDAGHMLTTLVFRVRNIPAALYKALGGFATNGVNMVKLESYVDAYFQAAQFYCDIEGHPEQDHVCLALEELDFFAREVKLLGTYKAHEFRDNLAKAA